MRLFSICLFITVSGSLLICFTALIAAILISGLRVKNLLEMDVFPGVNSVSAPLMLSNVDCRYFSLLPNWSNDSELTENNDIGFLSVFSPLGVDASSSSSSES